MSLLPDLFSTILFELENGRPIMWCVVLGKSGSAPQVPGAMMIVKDDSQPFGTIGGGCVEAEIRRRAFDLLQEKKSMMCDIVLDHDLGWDDGLLCGGCMTIGLIPLIGVGSGRPFADALDALKEGLPSKIPAIVEKDGKFVRYDVQLESEPRLLIAGAGHISQELAFLASRNGFQVTVVDNRADYLSEASFPDPIRRCPGDIGELFRTLPMDWGTYVVIVTRGHRHDRIVLEAVLPRPAKYIGMIGSNRKIRIMYDAMELSGVTKKELERVHAPIGLPINAITVQEISVSILAQLIETRRKDVGKAVSGPYPA